MSLKICFYLCLALLCVVQAESIEKEVVTAIDDIDNEKSFYLFGGLSVERIDSSRSFSTATNDVLDRINEYFQTHQLKWYPSLVLSEENARSINAEESRNRRIKKMILPLLLAIKLKMALIVPIMFMIIKFISIKALIVGTLALLFAGGALLKDLVAKKKDHVATAYITGTPINAEIVQTDWNRNGQASAQDLAYGYHTMPQATFQ